MIYITSATSGMLDSTIFQADGASVEVEQLNVTENKTYTAPEGVAYSPVVVNVPTGVFPTTQKGATTYTPSTSNQTIAAGTYLTGTQTITGDSDLVASNIKSGVNIFGVTGSYTGGGSKAVQIYSTPVSTNSTSMASTNMKLTVQKSGTYDIYVCVGYNRNSGTPQFQLQKTSNGSSTNIIGATNISTTTGNCEHTTVSLQANDVLTVYLKSAGSSYRAFATALIIIEQ